MGVSACQARDRPRSTRPTHAAEPAGAEACGYTATYAFLLPLLLATLLPLLMTGCGQRGANEEGAGSVVRISQRNEPADLDPATATLPDEFFIIRALGEGLLTPDPSGGSPRPAAAERFEVSADGLVYTFHLRRTGQWSNGEPMTADDFVASYRRLLTPATGAPKADLFYAVRNARAFNTGAIEDFSDVGIRAADSHTLIITLAQPALLFPHYVASGPWIPVHARTVERHGRRWTHPENHVGNGPFVLTEWSPQQRIAVAKNPRHHAASLLRSAGIQFVRFDSGDTEERAYRAGQIDITMAVPFTKVDVYARERPAELHRAPLAETRILTFNTTRAPLDDPRVRRALGLAIDRRQIVERVTRGGQEAAERFVSPVLRRAGGGTDAPLTSAFTHDLPEARRLLAAAGFGPTGKPFPKLEMTAWSPSQGPVLEAIQQMWKQELGIDVAIAIREAKVHLAALTTASYDIAFVTTLLDVADPAALLDDFTRGAPNNFAHWHSSEFDRSVGDATMARDADTRAALLAQAEDLLLREAAVAPVYFNTKNWLMAPSIQGWQEDALWQRDYLRLRHEQR